MAKPKAFKWVDKGFKKKLTTIRRSFKSINEKDDTFVRILWVHVFKDIMDHFEKESGPDGKWVPLSAVTLANRRGGGGMILQDTGNMRQSFKPFPHKTRGDALVFFNFANYSKIHDEGGKTTFGKRTVDTPQRKFMWISQEAMDNIAKSSIKYLETGK